MKRRLLIAAAGAALVLAACGKESGSTGASAVPGDGKSTPVTIEAIAAEAKGFSVGSAMNTRTIYVFFDPQCPHCAALWEAARPLKSQARFVWIPVALINPKSAPQGAAIMNAADPVAMMDQHEASIRNQQGGISGMGVTDAQKDIVRRNTDLMNRFGFGGVPTVVGKHAQSGALVTLEGSMPTAMLAQRLGLNPS
jgi:thiol:disulfide interchange protein DsbG